MGPRTPRRVVDLAAGASQAPARALRAADVAALEDQIAAWGQAVAAADSSSGHLRGPDEADLVGQVGDGKTVRGSQSDDGQTHLVSLVQHGSGVTLAQQAAAGQGQERLAVRDLLAGRDLHGIVVTLDALHMQRPLLQQILDQGGDYVAIAKPNQPELRAAIALLFV